jgi:hypothetical protein
MDPGNPFIGRNPANLIVSEVMTPEGRLGAVTIRTGGTTCTVLLSREDLAQWADVFQKQADQFSGLTVIRDPAHLPPPGPGAASPLAR